MAQPLDAILAGIHKCRSAAEPRQVVELQGCRARIARPTDAAAPHTAQQYEDILQVFADNIGRRLQAREAIRWLRNGGETALSNRLRQATRRFSSLAHPDGTLPCDLRKAIARRAGEVMSGSSTDAPFVFDQISLQDDRQLRRRHSTAVMQSCEGHTSPMPAAQDPQAASALQMAGPASDGQGSSELYCHDANAVVREVAQLCRRLDDLEAA